MSDLINQKQLEEALQISRSTIYRLRKEGMPFYTIGDQVRFDLEEVKTWMKKDKVPPNKTYKFVEPDVTRNEFVEVLYKGLGRKLTDQELRVLYWLGDCENETRGVLLDLFKELSSKR
ncbi:MAG TPA: helix-turn-helix domain-containing protein [Bacillus sp. (in: firmicutes)]|nr:helix-turn-helix domain-containing protein [Bacillus sp. (in: firmicutes)]